MKKIYSEKEFNNGNDVALRISWLGEWKISKFELL